MTGKRILFPLMIFAIAFLFCTSGIYASQVIKIGFVDQEEVFKKSKMGQNMESQIKALEDSKRVQIEQMQKDIEDLDKKIKNKDLPIIEQHREELKKEKRKKEIDLKYFYDEAYEQGNQ